MRWRPILFVVAAASLLRVLFLGSIPDGIFIDEIVNGYSAYSLALTLRDAWGHVLPLFVSHYGAHVVEPLYVYLLAPIVGIGGLGPWTVRIEAALVGTATVWLTYLLVRELADRPRAIWAATLLAVSPWHVPFSRLAFRGIWVPFAAVLALLLWYRIRHDERYLVGFAATIGIGLYTYTPVRVFFPLMLAALAITSPDIRRRVLRSRYRLPAAVLVVVLAIPIAIASLSPALSVRADHVLITSYADPVRTFAANLASHFSPSYLLFTGDPNPRHGVHGYGVLSPVTATLAVAFLALTVWRRRELWIFPTLVVCAFATSSLTTGGAHALRSIAALPFPQVMAALAIEDVANRSSRRAVRALAAVLIILYAGVVFIDYFRNQPLHHSGYDQDGRHHSDCWTYAPSQAMAWAESHRANYDGVAFSSSIGAAYMYPAFWVPIPPSQFQDGQNVSPYHVLPADSLERAHQTIPRALFVVKMSELPDAPAVKVIRFADGQPALRLVESAPTASRPDDHTPATHTAPE